MLRKFIILIVVLFLSFSIFTCSNRVSNSTGLSLEQSIKQIISSKGPGYDFLKDQGYMDHMARLGDQLVTNQTTDPVHYSIGNLDKDNIPELVVFKERDSNDLDDEGSLELYQFNGDKYALLDKTSMNFDNSNYQIVIGKIGQNQNGIFLNNQVGAHSGVTYGFIVEDGKFKSILNDDKLPLISIYTDNEIKDINGDGILNFSILTIDPESEISNLPDSDKMTLWYQWNERDSGTLLMVERQKANQAPSNKPLFNQIQNSIESNFFESIDFIKSSRVNLSKFDNTILLMKYIEQLDQIQSLRSREVDHLFGDYQENNSFDYIFKKYGLTMEKLNRIEYLQREKVLKDETGLKENIIENIGLGYKLSASGEFYHYLIDYQFFLDSFSGNITNEYRDYLSLLALNSNNPYMLDGSLSITMEDLVERILLAESFQMVYPYSIFLPEVNNIYKEYIYSYFYGDIHNPNFNRDTLIFKAEILGEYKETISKYEYSSFSNIIEDFMELLKENKNIINDELREKLNNRLN